MLKRPSVNITPVADKYAGPDERIVEYIDKHGNGGLVSLKTGEDGTLSVDLYRHGPKVRIRVGLNELGEPSALEAAKSRLLDIAVAGKRADGWYTRSDGAGFVVIAEEVLALLEGKTHATAVRQPDAGRPIVRHLSEQDLNTILAALCYYQDQGMGEPANRPDWIQDIATNGDTEFGMGDDGIDYVCERLNCGENTEDRDNSM